MNGRTPGGFRAWKPYTSFERNEIDSRQREAHEAELLKPHGLCRVHRSEAFLFYAGCGYATGCVESDWVLYPTKAAAIKAKAEGGVK